MTKFIELNRTKGGILVNTDAIKTVIPINGGCFQYNENHPCQMAFVECNTKVILENTEDVILAEETYEEIKELLKDEI